MRCCRGIESGGGGAIHETHHISTALITSTLLPCVSDGFWEVGSGGSALSIPPTYSMFSLSFVTAGLVLLTFCLFMQIGRCSLFSRAGSSFLDSWAPFWKFPRLVSTYRSAAAFSWDPQPEEEEVGKKKANWRRMGEKEADWLERAGQSLLHFVWRMGAKGDGEKSGVKRIKQSISVDLKCRHMYSIWLENGQHAGCSFDALRPSLFQFPARPLCYSPGLLVTASNPYGTSRQRCSRAALVGWH